MAFELNWEQANAWQETVNAPKEEFNQPKWNWDCNFKLDFDGPLLSLSSRFYPPHYNKRGGWEGSVKILFMGTPILKKEFNCSTLEQLHKEVEAFTAHYASAIKPRILP